MLIDTVLQKLLTANFRLLAKQAKTKGETMKIISNKLAHSIAATTLIGLSAQAGAVVVNEYTVTNTAEDSCGTGSAPYGLWTNNDFGDGASCNNYFSIQEGGTLTTYDNEGDDGIVDSATLSFTAKNSAGDLATVEFFLDGYVDSYALSKDFGDLNDDQGEDTPNSIWDFFTNISDESSITIDFADGSSSLDGFSQDDVDNHNSNDDSDSISFTYSNFGFVTPQGYDDPLVVQYGYGANDKNASFGLSTWFTNDSFLSDHWDINVTLVPEPGTIGLLGLGLLGLGIARRRKIS